MFTLHDALLLMLLPFTLAAIVTALAWRRKSSLDNPRVGGWAMTLALPAALLAAGLVQFPPKGIPREAMDTLILLPTLALLFGLLAHLPRWWIAPILMLIAGALNTWLIAMHLAAGTVSWTLFLLLAIAPAFLFLALRPIIKNCGGPGILLMLLMIAGATVIVESAGTFIQFGQYTVALPATLAGILLTRLVLRRPQLSPATWAAFILLWTALLTFGYLWADVPAVRTMFLAIAPLFAWPAEFPRSLRPLPRALLRLALVAIPLSIAAIPAAIDLYKLLHSQTEVGGY